MSPSATSSPDKMSDVDTPSANHFIPSMFLNGSETNLLLPSPAAGKEDRTTVIDDDDRDAQYITILPGMAYHTPPATPCHLEKHFLDQVPVSFTCDSLSDECQLKTAAQLVHEEQTLVIDGETLQRLDTELVLSPTEVFSEVYMESIGKHTLLPVQDVPSDLEDDDEDDSDYSSLDSEGSTRSLVPSGAVVQDTPRKPDRRLVVPFEEFDRDRFSGAPTSHHLNLCGIFSRV